MVVFDTESRTDATQRLTFGSYRALIRGRCLEEGLFYAEDLTAKELRTLKRYVRTHKPDTVSDGTRKLRLLTLRDFLQELFPAVYKTRGLFVAFNHPFDLSRIAHDYGAARGRYTGGFSLGLWTYVDKNGIVRRNSFRPRVVIKHIDSKRALIAFKRRRTPDREDLIPEGSTNWQTKERLWVPRPFSRSAHTCLRADGQRLFLRVSVREVWRRARKKESGASRNHHREIHRLQSPRCVGHLGASYKVTRRVRQTSDFPSGYKGFFAGVDR